MMKSPTDLTIRTMEFVLIVVACCFVLRAYGIGTNSTMLVAVVLGAVGFVALNLLRDRMDKRK